MQLSCYSSNGCQGLLCASQRLSISSSAVPQELANPVQLLHGAEAKHVLASPTNQAGVFETLSRLLTGITACASSISSPSVGDALEAAAILEETKAKLHTSTCHPLISEQLDLSIQSWKVSQTGCLAGGLPAPFLLSGTGGL